MPFIFPLVVYDGSDFSISLSTFVFVCLFEYSHPSECKIVSYYGSICISLVTNYIKHFSYAYWPFVFILWRNAYSNLLPTFKLGVCLLLSCKTF